MCLCKLYSCVRIYFYDKCSSLPLVISKRHNFITLNHLNAMILSQKFIFHPVLCLHSPFFIGLLHYGSFHAKSPKIRKISRVTISDFDENANSPKASRVTISDFDENANSPKASRVTISDFDENANSPKASRVTISDFDENANSPKASRVTISDFDENANSPKASRVTISDFDENANSPKASRVTISDFDENWLKCSST